MKCPSCGAEVTGRFAATAVHRFRPLPMTILQSQKIQIPIVWWMTGSPSMIM